MKKLIFACIFISCASLLKAQQSQVKPQGSFVNPMDNYFKPGTEIKPDTYNLLTPKLNFHEAFAININKTADLQFFSKMPVAKLDGVDKMPVAKLEGYDNMPILGFDVYKARKEALSRSY